MKNLLRAGAMALALFLSPMMALAQIASVPATGGTAPLGSPCVMQAGTCVSVAPTAPLPVSPIQLPAASTPLTGTAATVVTAGPFAPELARPINLTLSGTWTGAVQLLRSIDGGTTLTPLTVGGTGWASYSGNVNEQAWVENESGATYYLFIAPTSGTVAYRVAQ